MKKYLKIGCLSLLGLASVAIIALLLLALFAEPMPSTAEALATVPESELTALKQITALAGIEPTDLRNINSYEGTIFDDDRNRTSIVIKGGHIVGLCIRKANFSALPDPTGLTFLEALDWRECSLTRWPDFSKLRGLKQLKLSGQALPDALTSHLPPGLVLLHLADTAITDTTPFASLTSLTELVLSGTQVTTFEPLIQLRLNMLDLANTKINTLPISVPQTGDWAVDLDGTPLLTPPNYSAEWPLVIASRGVNHKDDSTRGTLTRDLVEVTGTADATTESRAIALPRGTDSGVPTVNLTVTCTAGEGLIWLQEPPDFFPSPWMKQRKVKGFGVFRNPGYVSAALKPGQSCTLRGNLRLTMTSRIYDLPAYQRNGANAPPDWCDYSFYIQPLHGTTLSGIEYTIEAAP